MAKSIMQSEKECYITGATYNLDLHHVFQGSRRKTSDKWGCTVWLRHDIHMKLHDSDIELDRLIKRECQKEFEKRYGHEKFMEVFGKNYI